MAQGKVAAIIPARMGSSRYPGKPLVPILGLPMIEHVRRRVLKMKGIDLVVVATCDQEIADVVRAAGGHAVMTSDRHERATERIEEAARSIEADIIINVQGDEPMVLEEPIMGLLRAFSNPDVRCACLAYPILDTAELNSDNIVKTVLSRSGQMIYFSRSPIPGRKPLPSTQYFKQSGIMAFRKETLHQFTKMEMTPLEIQESVDLLRLLENDITVQAVISKMETRGVDVPAQVAEVEAAIMSDPEQRQLFESIR
jgi:3-deoxy-manno-octulosonate cytidylyltransferase (CMP-KDO synthetase)